MGEQGELEHIKEELATLSREFAKLRKYAPPIAAKQAWRLRLAFEVTGVAIAAVGFWWIYPPAALVLIGAWMLGDVLAMRHAKKKRKE